MALRDTAYTISQTPRLTGQFTTPAISHSALNRTDVEASIDIRPPALERDYELPYWHRELRHVIEPELNYRYVGGIGVKAQNVLLFDTADIASNVNEAGFSLTQRFYLRPTGEKPCGTSDQDGGNSSDAGRRSNAADDTANAGDCPSAPREWATWEIAQEYFIDPNFGGALIPGRRNVFDATLDLMAPTFLTSPRNIAPITSRIRFEAIDNLRIQWDLAYDTIAGQLAADNVFAGYSFGRTTLGIGHALLNAVDDQVTNGTTPTTPATFSTLKSQQMQPFLEFGKPSGNGLNLAVNGGYDFVQHEVQYGGVQAVYNWNCCGLTLGLPAFRTGHGGLNQPRRDPVALQLHPGQLRSRGRHPPRQLGVPRSHVAAGVLALQGCISARHASIAYRPGNGAPDTAVKRSSGVSFPEEKSTWQMLVS